MATNRNQRMSIYCIFIVRCVLDEKPTYGVEVIRGSGEEI